MKRNSLLKILNPVLAVLFVNQVLTGLLNDFIPEEAYEFLHEGGGVLLAIAAVTHLVLNWTWVKTTYFKNTPKS